MKKLEMRKEGFRLTWMCPQCKKLIFPKVYIRGYYEEVSRVDPDDAGVCEICGYVGKWWRVPLRKIIWGRKRNILSRIFNFSPYDITIKRQYWEDKNGNIVSDDQGNILSDKIGAE